MVDRFFGQRAAFSPSLVVLIHELLNDRCALGGIFFSQEINELIDLTGWHLLHFGAVGGRPLALHFVQQLLPGGLLEFLLMQAPGRQDDLNAFAFRADRPNRDVVQVRGVDAALEGSGQLVARVPLVAILQRFRFIDFVNKDSSAD